MTSGQAGDNPVTVATT